MLAPRRTSGPPRWPAGQPAGSLPAGRRSAAGRGCLARRGDLAGAPGQGLRRGISILRDYLYPKRGLRPGRATVRFETDPGRQLQSDWATQRTVIAGEATTVHVIVNTLSYSRRFLVYGDRGRRAHLRRIGPRLRVVRRRPWRGLADNQKSAVLADPRGGDVRFHPRFSDLAGHYECSCPARAGRRARRPRARMSGTSGT
jgi:transposase